MGRKLTKLTSRLIEFINGQKLFFVATAMAEGRVNLSPKGMDTFQVLEANRVLWLNLTGSGNETATHISYNNRLTIMFCAFEGSPLILRLYGAATVYHAGDKYWENHIHMFPEIAGSRQLVELKIDLVQTSCGMGVPLMEYRGERNQLDAWASELGEDGLKEYREKKNLISIDGVPTDLGRQ